MGIPALEPETGPAQEYFLTLAELEDHVRRRHGWSPELDQHREEPEWPHKLAVDHWHGEQHAHAS